MPVPTGTKVTPWQCYQPSEVLGIHGSHEGLTNGATQSCIFSKNETVTTTATSARLAQSIGHETVRRQVTGLHSTPCPRLFREYRMGDPAGDDSSTNLPVHLTSAAAENKIKN